MKLYLEILRRKKVVRKNLKVSRKVLQITVIYILATEILSDQSEMRKKKTTQNQGENLSSIARQLSTNKQFNKEIGDSYVLKKSLSSIHSQTQLTKSLVEVKVKVNKMAMSYTISHSSQVFFKSIL